VTQGDKVVRAVRTSKLCAAAKIAPSTLAYWVRVGVVKPSVIGPSGHRYERWWSLSDVVAIKTVKALRDSGCPLQTVRRAVALLRSLDQDLASSRLVWDGEDVFIQDEFGSIVSAFRRPGQLVLHATVLPLADWARESDEISEEISVRIERRRRRSSRSRRSQTTRLSS